MGKIFCYKSQHNLFFIKLKTRFGPCFRPSSGHNIYVICLFVGENYTM